MFGNKDRNDNSTPTIKAASAPMSTPKNNNNNNSQDAITAYLGPDIQIEGTLKFQSSVLIEGNFKGRIESEHGTLVVGESATVEGDIVGGNISIRGKVEGSINATERVHIQDRGVFIGEVCTPSLRMDESVTFEGSCSMPNKDGKPSNAKAKGSQTEAKVKETEEKILDAVGSVS